ncbi:hypothetical protein [Andreprevotia chitinilytica]|uniref:hypothetical protein n=1 Tax=Andreprevotia chitinilytica TaxID=396808 RepID=UPI00055658E4|nr:hypothetical protein [Andreprevotia chitinilytica]
MASSLLCKHKKAALCSALSVLSTFVIATQSIAAINYYDNGYQIGVVRPGGDRPCMLFQLVGVSQSDPTVAPGSPWFSIPQTAPGYKDMVATILMAKATSKPIFVQTSGQSPAECGHTGVATIQLL